MSTGQIFKVLSCWDARCTRGRCCVLVASGKVQASKRSSNSRSVPCIHRSHLSGNERPRPTKPKAKQNREDNKHTCLIATRLHCSHDRNFYGQHDPLISKISLRDTYYRHIKLGLPLKILSRP